MTQDFVCTPTTEKLCRKIFAGEEYIIPPFLDAKVIVDVGANVGAMTVYLRQKFPDATIYAIEPSSESFSLLKLNTRDDSNVRAYQFAMSEYAGHATLKLGSDGRATDSLYPNRFATEATEFVEVRNLSIFLSEFGEWDVDLLKIDTEGSEIPILSGFRKRLPFTGTILIEYHGEEDRLAIDMALAKTHTLYAARADRPHRGVLTYISHQLAEEQHLNDYRITAV